MNSVELLEEAMDAARRVGFDVREEWFGGSGGGACVVRGKKLLLLDLNLGPRDRLLQVVEALRVDPQTADIIMTTALRRLVTTPAAA
jgi:hypothetical protein